MGRWVTGWEVKGGSQMSSRKTRMVFLPLPGVLIKTQNLLFVYLNKTKKHVKRKKIGASHFNVAVLSPKPPTVHAPFGVGWNTLNAHTLTRTHSG